jgi:hypothetical protein
MASVLLVWYDGLASCTNGYSTQCPQPLNTSTVSTRQQWKSPDTRTTAEIKQEGWPSPNPKLIMARTPTRPTCLLHSSPPRSLRSAATAPEIPHKAGAPQATPEIPQGRLPKHMRSTARKTGGTWRMPALRRTRGLRGTDHRVVHLVEGGGNCLVAPAPAELALLWMVLPCMQPLPGGYSKTAVLALLS